MPGFEWFGDEERKEVQDVLDTGVLFRYGFDQARKGHWKARTFEEELSRCLGSGYAHLCSSGTSALGIALAACGVSAGDEVIVPPFTFVATVEALLTAGAIPVFAEIDETLCLDPQSVRAAITPRTRAVMPVHMCGAMARIDELKTICDEKKLVLIEDAAESLGSYYKGRHTGQRGRISALSFNGNKIITTGGGGAILTNDSELGALAKHMTTTAKLPHRWEFNHDRVGYNYRLPNLNAAVGCAQIEQLPDFIRRKRKLAKAYQDAFNGIKGATIFSEPEFAESNYWLNAIILSPEYADLRDDILAKTHEAGLLTRPAWTLMYKLPMYQDCPRMECDVAEQISARLINIPSSSSLLSN